MNAEEEMQAWQRWREACALSLISEADGRQLTLTISQRFRSMLRKVNLHGGGQLSAPSDRECAHLFEAYCAVHQRRDGKKYKHWLLTRGRQDLDTVQSGVMLLVRNVVREWIRHAHPRTAPVSLQQPVGGSATPLPLEQLLPDRSPEGRSGEQTAWLHAQVDALVSAADPLKRTVLILRATGRVFSAAGVKEEFGYGKSVLHDCQRSLLKELGESARDRFPEITPEQGCSLVLDLMDRAGHRFLSDSFPENSSAPAFGEAEVHDDD